MTLYLLRFNNYVNRIVKRYETRAEYPEALYIAQQYNFNPNDGVLTDAIVGQGEIIEIPDYCLVCDEEDNIVSRWFVIEAVRTLGGQYRLQLYRDTVVDYWGVIADAPAFIEKGYINDVNNPLLLNNEDMTFNQIKQSEKLLKDETNCAWIVGYLSNTGKSISGKVNTPDNFDISVTGKPEDWEYAKYSNLTQTGHFSTSEATGMYMDIETLYATNYNDASYITAANYSTFRLRKIAPSSISYSLLNRESKSGLTITATAPGRTSIDLIDTTVAAENIDVDKILNIFNNMLPGYLPIEPDAQDGTLFSLVGRTIYFQETNEAFSISLEELNDSVESVEINNDTPNILIELQNALPMYSLTWLGYPYTCKMTNQAKIYRSYKSYRLNLTPINVSKYISYEISATRNFLTDAPYSMFCIPWITNNNDITFIINNDKSFIPSNSETFAIINDISRQEAGENGLLYDIQLLPYCPLNFENNDNVIEINDYSNITKTGFTPAIDYSLITEIIDGTETPCGIIFYSKKSNFTKDIIIDEININTTPEEFKIQNNCDVYRLCSPNYNGIFEFSITKNGGISKFNIDCTYKPFNPYIHINPDFGNLYGRDFNDQRGLNCGGEFSLPIITNAWETYERQNKNYLNSFNRQIENMEINNSVQRTKDIAGIVFGGISGTTSGATAGSAGGPWGAVAGGIVGGLASTAGGIIDYNLNEILRNEAIDYTKDQFGYQLGNIQALPASLARTSAFTANNKIFPFLEYYTCTDVEKEALRNKIKYNGMTIMVVDNISKYINYNTPQNSYIKAKIIRLPGIEDEYHLANTIVRELNQGVFV